MTDVIVIGAGPTGTATAIELARRGVRVRVLDAAPGPRDGSRGFGIQPRSLEVLDPTAADRLLAAGGPEPTIRRHHVDGTTTEEVMNPGIAPSTDRPRTSVLMIPQWRTERVLHDRLAELGVAIEWDARATGLDQDRDGVTVTLDDGRRCTAAWVVGADGGHSGVRHALGVRFAGETFDARMVFADVEVDGLDPDGWHVWEATASAAPIGLCPMPGSRWWQLHATPVDTTLPATDDRLRALAADLTPRVTLGRIGWRSAWNVNVRLAERYRDRRVFLVGDAAHAHSPAGGQGMNTGLQDAVNLGWKLAAVLTGAADAALLDTYAAERRPVAADVLALSQRMRRHGILAHVDRADTLQFGISYRGGPLDGGRTDGPGPRPGDRAPEAPLAGGTTVFGQRRRSDWVRLAFGGAAATGGSGPGSLVDASGPAATTYAAADGETVLIRPDGHVGWRGTDLDDLRAWAGPVGCR